MFAVSSGAPVVPMSQPQNPPGESSTMVKTIVLALTILGSAASMAALPVELGLAFSAVLLAIGFGTYFTSCSMPSLPDFGSSGGWFSNQRSVVPQGSTLVYSSRGGVTQPGARHGVDTNRPSGGWWNPFAQSAPMHGGGGLPNIHGGGVARHAASGVNPEQRPARFAPTPMVQANGGAVPNIHGAQQGARHGVGGVSQPASPIVPPQQPQSGGGVPNPHQTQQGARHPVGT